MTDLTDLWPISKDMVEPPIMKTVDEGGAALMDKRRRSYARDGKTYAFDVETYRKALKSWAAEQGLGLGEARSKLGSAIHVSESTLRSWSRGINAPDDEGRIRSLEKAMGLGEGYLLKEKVGEDMDKFTDAQKASISRIYQAVSNFVYMFEETDGCAWKDYEVPAGSYAATCVNPAPAYGDGTFRFEGTDLACMAYNWTLHVTENEWVYLGSHPIYGELNAFFEGPLSDMWVGKTNPDYRFEDSLMQAEDAEPVDPNDPSVPWRESEFVMKQLRDLIAKYL